MIFLTLIKSLKFPLQDITHVLDYCLWAADIRKEVQSASFLIIMNKMQELPAMLGFLVQAGWPLALGGFSSCSSSRFGVWLQGGDTWPLQSMVVSLESAMPLRSAVRRWSRKAHTNTVLREKLIKANKLLQE